VKVAEGSWVPTVTERTALPYARLDLKEKRKKTGDNCMVRGTCQVCRKEAATTSVDLQVCEKCAEKYAREDLNAQVDLVEVTCEYGHKHLVPISVTDGEKP